MLWICHARELLRLSATIILKKAAPTFQSSILLAKARSSAESKGPPSSKRRKTSSQANRSLSVCCLHGICIDDFDGYGFRNGSEIQVSYEDMAFQEYLSGICC